MSYHDHDHDHPLLRHCDGWLLSTEEIDDFMCINEGNSILFVENQNETDFGGVEDHAILIFDHMINVVDVIEDDTANESTKECKGVCMKSNNTRQINYQNQDSFNDVSYLGSTSGMQNKSKKKKKKEEKEDEDDDLDLSLSYDLVKLPSVEVEHVRTMISEQFEKGSADICVVDEACDKGWTKMAPSNQPIARRLPDQRVPITPLLVFDDDEFENCLDVSRIRKESMHFSGAYLQSESGYQVCRSVQVDSPYNKNQGLDGLHLNITPASSSMMESACRTLSSSCMSKQFRPISTRRNFKLQKPRGNKASLNLEKKGRSFKTRSTHDKAKSWRP